MSRKFLLSLERCEILQNMRNRRNYTHPEAQAVLKDWVRRKKWTPTQFHRWLELNGVTVTRQYVATLVTGEMCAGPKFKQIFKEITGIVLIDGLVEDERKRTAQEAK